MKPPVRLALLTTLWIWVGLAQGAATVGLTQSASAGETSYFGPVAWASINAATNSPNLTDVWEARMLLAHLPEVARLYAANGEPSYSAGPGACDRVVRYMQLGTLMNPGSWIATFTERRDGAVLFQLSGLDESRGRDPVRRFLGRDLSLRALTEEEAEAYRRLLEGFDFADCQPRYLFQSSDAPAYTLEIRDVRTHFVSTIAGLTDSDAFWMGLRALTLRCWRQTCDVSLRFRPDGKRGFSFDTGILRGRLYADGRPLGLTEVYHIPTGARLDCSNGLLSHYRVFGNGRRFGDGAWNWLSTAKALEDGSVEIRWLAIERPFEMCAIYRLTWPGVVQVQTTIWPWAELKGFEVFLASYFDAAFTNAVVSVRNGNDDAFAEATPGKGDWQMYVRDDDARTLAEDGRWKIEPHPVAWTYPARLPERWIQGLRRAPAFGLTVAVTAQTHSCFALATPHQTEGHFSTYVSLFGRNLPERKYASSFVELSLGTMEK